MLLRKYQGKNRSLYYWRQRRKRQTCESDEELALSYFQCLQKLCTSFNLLQKELTAEELVFPDVLYIEKCPDLELLAPVLKKRFLVHYLPLFAREQKRGTG